MSKRIAAWWGIQYDMKNLPGEDWMENMESAASPQKESMPQKTLRERGYETSQPLMLRTKYKGDFLDEIRNKSGESIMEPSTTNLYDISMPSDWSKHQEEPDPRIIEDGFYQYNRPDFGVGDSRNDSMHRPRIWDQYEVPEMSLDKNMRVRDDSNTQLKKPLERPIKLKKFPRKAARGVVQSFLFDRSSVTLEIDVPGLRESKVLSDFQNSRIKTQKGSNPVDPSGVSVRLKKAEPRLGRWTFHTWSSGSKSKYVTTFQFIPQGVTRDTKKLQVRCNCTCNSWLYWGAQYHAILGDYLYGPIRPKFVAPKKRDPQSQFLVCKHVLACIPYASRYKVERGIKAPVFKFKVKKNVPEETLKIPAELEKFRENPFWKSRVEAVESNWDKWGPAKKKRYIFDLDDPDFITFLAHRFPDTATAYVAERLKFLSENSPNAEIRRKADEDLASIL